MQNGDQRHGIESAFHFIQPTSTDLRTRTKSGQHIHQSKFIEASQNTPGAGIRSTTDAFWIKSTNGETSLITPREARSYRGTHFSFSFVRNPFDRLVSAYNNKVLELDDVTRPMQEMGLRHNMPFAEFLEQTVNTEDDKLDVHLLTNQHSLCRWATDSFIRRTNGTNAVPLASLTKLVAKRTTP